MQGTHQLFVDRGTLEHAGVEVLDYGQLGRGHGVADRGGTTIHGFSAQQVGQDLVARALALQPRGDRLIRRNLDVLGQNNFRRRPVYIEQWRHRNRLFQLRRFTEWPGRIAHPR